jgi:hypothetical protein
MSRNRIRFRTTSAIIVTVSLDGVSACLTPSHSFPPRYFPRGRNIGCLDLDTKEPPPLGFLGRGPFCVSEGSGHHCPRCGGGVLG